MAKLRFTVLIEEEDDGFVAECPTFQGCYTQGETYEEALENIRDLIKIHLARHGPSFVPHRDVRGYALSTVEIEA